ncbi:Methionyl-tRNA formyltransferase [Xylographa trunciseda]|nr:Methionyl-tRNA formyltransferase [Xylographa trunciseda]
MIIQSQLRRSPLLVQQSHILQIRRRLLTKSAEPLRILFCGADEFSIASLEALHHEKEANPDLIKSIDVVCKVGKKHGRGLKNVREVPLCPRPEGHAINLVIAVSFGLLIPARVLENANYGGLNVHPSLLPDFRGAAPIQWALLHKCKMTGITLQTLHPRHFDEGKILLQTPHPGLEIPNTDSITPSELTDFLAPKGADLLLRGLRERVFSSRNDLKPKSDLTRPAPKITPEDRHIDWSKWSAQEILRRHRIIGPLWSRAAVGHVPGKDEKRVVWSSGFETVHISPHDTKPGLGLILASDPSIYIRTVDQQILRAKGIIVEGLGNKEANLAVNKAKMVDLHTSYILGTIETHQLWRPFT